SPACTACSASARSSDPCRGRRAARPPSRRIPGRNPRTESRDPGTPSRPAPTLRWSASGKSLLSEPVTCCPSLAKELPASVWVRTAVGSRILLAATRERGRASEARDGCDGKFSEGKKNSDERGDELRGPALPGSP